MDPIVVIGVQQLKGLEVLYIMDPIDEDLYMMDPIDVIGVQQLKGPEFLYIMDPIDEYDVILKAA